MLQTFGDENQINKIARRFISHRIVGYSGDYTQVCYEREVEWTDGTTQTIYTVDSTGELSDRPRYLSVCPHVEVAA